MKSFHFLTGIFDDAST